MASQGKRMVPEYLIKYLEGLYNSGIDPTGFQPKLTAGDGIAIDEDNEITYDPETAAPLMENIVDSAGNKRFIEGGITTVEISGVTYTYAKWSLSGSHLMVVLAGTVADETVLPTAVIASADIPEYIYDKIYPVVNDVVLRSSQTFFATNYSVQSATLSLVKGNNSNISIYLNGITLTADRSFRFQFDLLIDAE